MASQHIGACGIDDEPLSQRDSAKQHSKQHGVPVGQSKFYRKVMHAQLQIGCYDITFLAVSARIGYPALVDYRSLADHCRAPVTLVGMHTEAHPCPAGFFEGLDKVGVQGRGARTGIHLDLDVSQAQCGQGDPFTPPDNFWIVRVSLHFLMQPVMPVADRDEYQLTQAGENTTIHS